MNSDAMDHWIIEKRPRDRNFVPPERLVWVDVEGLPLRVWSKEAFRKILAKWGSIVHIDDALGEDVYKNRICVLTNFQNIIFDVLKVKVDDHVFSVRIKEAPGWIPSFSCLPPSIVWMKLYTMTIFKKELELLIIVMKKKRVLLTHLASMIQFKE